MSAENDFFKLNLLNNDYFSSMDMNTVLKRINNYYLDYREVLDFSDDITFGLEIEVDNIRWIQFYNIEDDKKFENWKFIRDDSLDNGKEIISCPLINTNDTWMQLSDLLNRLGDCTQVLSTCGGHIHIGTQAIGNNYNHYINLLKLWAAYENIIYRFGYGEYISSRHSIIEFASPIFKHVKSFMDGNISSDIFFYKPLHGLNYANLNVDKMSNYNRYQENQTIEVRCCNCSLNPIIWQNCINFFVKLFLYAKSDIFNNDLVYKRINNLYKNMTFLQEDRNEIIMYQQQLNFYNQIDLVGAIELADLIFDKNIDKVYFLRQYIKNYEVGIEELEKGTKFTKHKNY